MVDFTVLSLSEKVVKAILEDLTDRRGLRQEWEQIDEDIQREIRSTWVRSTYRQIDDYLLEKKG